MLSQEKFKDRRGRRKNSGTSDRTVRQQVTDEVRKFSELKFVYGVFTVTETLNDGKFVPFSFCTAVPNGSNINSRLGNRIYVHSIHVILEFVPNPLHVTNTNPYCEWAVYHNRSSNGTQTNGWMLFLENQVAQLPNPFLESYLRVLKSGSYSMELAPTNNTTAPGAFNTSGYSNGAGTVKVDIPINESVVYNGTSNTIADLFLNDYGIMVATSQANSCSVKIRYAMRFTDL